MSIWRLGDQQPPQPRRVTAGVVMRFDHVYEVDPRLMGHFPQQDIPAWDTRRIVDSRWEHLDWMHNHFADEVLLAGRESETGIPGERKDPVPVQTAGQPPNPVTLGSEPGIRGGPPS